MKISVCVCVCDIVTVFMSSDATLGWTTSQSAIIRVFG